MESKITVMAGNKPLVLTDDSSIDIDFQNPLFNDNEMYSYPISLPLEGNRHFLRNIDDINSDIRPIQFEHTPMRILVDGMPLASGLAVIQEDENLEDSLSLNIDADKQSFTDLIGDLMCNEVPIPDRYKTIQDGKSPLLIGEKIDEVNVQIKYHTDVVIKGEGKKPDKQTGTVGDFVTSGSFSPQALGFSYPAKCVEVPDNPNFEAQVETTLDYPDGNTVNKPIVQDSYINVSTAYPDALYCNARICYSHHDKDDDGSTSDNIVPNLKDDAMYEDYGPLWVLEADRPQSGICFYVLFFLDCLFEHLGVKFDKTALTAIADMNRLCFFTTKCAYDTAPLHYNAAYTENDDAVIAGRKNIGDIKVGCFNKTIDTVDKTHKLDTLFDDVNAWLDSRGCGGRLNLQDPKDKSVQEITFYRVTYEVHQVTDERFPDSVHPIYKMVKTTSTTPTTLVAGQAGVSTITTKTKITGAQMSASVVQMIANEQNFPNETVTAVIDSLESQFGIKFHYDYEQKQVTAYLIRDVFRNQGPIRPLRADITQMIPISEKITGVRVGYTAESDQKEQRLNVKNGIKDYNTDYDYIDYKRNSTITDMVYKDIIRQVYNNQMNLFIDQTTGNKFRVKIDSNFTDFSNMQPKLFEVGAHKGVTIGDCSTVNEDYVIELKSDFIPVNMVDVNYRKALLASAASNEIYAITDDTPSGEHEGETVGIMIKSINSSNAQTILSAFIDEDMEHEFVKQYIQNPLSSDVADCYVQEELTLRESYDPSSTEDGNSPLQSYDWGLSIAIMRGGGVDTDSESYDNDYDGFGNSKWRTVSGQYALTTDTIDAYGNLYDYNGTEAGIGDGERFSLKPRAWVQPDWSDHPLIVSDPLVRDRGYVDRFLIDYIHFLLNRKKYLVRCSCTVAQIVDIPNHWMSWWNIAGKKCLINKVSTSITAQEGIGQVELEVYAL